jgi:hypothetical protein
MIDFNNAEKQVLNFASQLLEGQNERTPKMIREFVDNSAILAQVKYPNLPVDVESIISELEHTISVITLPSFTLTNQKVSPWWLEKKQKLEPMKFWHRYRKYLETEKHFHDKVLHSIEKQTDDVLEKLQDPEVSGPWDVRGMVVGSVQSGKTANYVGVIAKALDAGYKIIIVMAGIHNNLRAQTQERIDEGIVGMDSQRRLDPNRNDYRKGVGKLIMPAEFNPPPSITPMTTSSDNGDFTAGAQTVNVSLNGSPLILVIKKNKSPLTHILKWLEVTSGQLGHASPDEPIKGIPLLLIDDEADNASINTKARPQDEEGEDPEAITTTNRLIRLILKRFDKSSYIGYTATPFANIFIDPESQRDEEGSDLFPRDFIVNVRPNSKYVGPARVFGYDQDSDTGIGHVEPLPIFRHVDDHDLAFPPRHRKEHDPGALPGSLKEAIKSFILSCAGRRCRGQRKVHNSMLIHVTRLTAVQTKTKELIDDYLRTIFNGVKYDRTGTARKELQDLWESDFKPCTEVIKVLEKDDRLTSLPWETVERELGAVVDKMCVMEIHGQSKDELNYANSPDGLSVIAVGGNKLSRGLTLEGLTVSYFLRSTKMYDTLMQMGRWFGYREGYLDLCRLHTTYELRGWFRHIAFAEEELKREFKKMSLAKLTPNDYGLRVRQHPDGMSVTAMNKMAFGKSREVTFAGKLVQDSVFCRDAGIQSKRARLVETWLEGLSDKRKDSRDRLRWNASGEQILSLLKSFGTLGPIQQNDRFGPELMTFIEKQEESGGLTNWTVIIPHGGATEIPFKGIQTPTVMRKDVTGDEPIYSTAKRNILSPADEILDLDEIILTPDILSEILAKGHSRHPTEPALRLIEQGRESEAITRCIGQTLEQVVKVLAECRGNLKLSQMKEEIKEIRPHSNGLLLIYLLDTAKIRELDSIPYLPGFVMSFPSTDRAKRVNYMVNAAWVKEHLEQIELEDI